MRLLTDPIKPPTVLAYSEAAAIHMRRARLILRDDFRNVARLYLILLAIEAESHAEINDAKAYQGMLHSYGFMGTPPGSLAVALKTMGLYDMERHESKLTGFVIGKYNRPEHNPHVNYPTDNGITATVIAQDFGKAWVTAEINFTDASQSRVWPSRLCATHREAFEYAGQVISLAQSLMMYSEV